MLCQWRTGPAKRDILDTVASGPACIGCQPVHDRCLAVAAQIKRIFVLMK